MTPPEMRKLIRQGWTPGTTGKGLVDTLRGKVYTWPTEFDDDWQRTHDDAVRALGLNSTPDNRVGMIVLAEDGAFGVHYPYREHTPDLIELVERTLTGAYYNQVDEDYGYQA